MNTTQQILRLCRNGILSVCVLALAACQPPATPPPTFIVTVVTATAPPPPCVPLSSTGAGPFSVIPRDTGGFARACVQPPATSWQEIASEHLADWSYGVGTFLESAAVVYFPEDEGQILMQPNSALQLPTSQGGDVSVLWGTFYVSWYKLGSNIGAIASGSQRFDPEYAVFEIRFDADTSKTVARVYAGEIIAQYGDNQERTISIWQQAVFDKQNLLSVDAITDSPPEELRQWLEDQRVPIISPWKLTPDTPLPTNPVLDPTRATSFYSLAVLSQLMEGLFRVSPESKIIPAGAEEYEVSDDKLIHTFSLQKKAVWSDGQPVIAKDYLAGICRVGDPASAAPLAPQLYFIAGFEDYHTGRTTDCSSVGVSALDDYTLQITLAKPMEDVSNLFTSPLTYPLRLDVIKACGERWTNPGCFVSNGQYTLNAWQPGSFISLVKNGSYWNVAQVPVEKLDFSIKSVP